MNDRGVPIRASVEWWVTRGAIGGMVAGIAFALYTMAFAALMDGGQALFTPLRLIGAIVIGAVALDRDYPLLVAALAGGLVHLAFAIFFGVVFASIAGVLHAVRDSRMSLPVSATVYGFILWLINFHVVAPAAGWGWLPASGLTSVQLLAHTFGFGTVLGVYLDRTLFRPPLGRSQPRAVLRVARLRRVQ